MANKYYAALAKIREGNKMDGKVLFQQAVFGLDDIEVKNHIKDGDPVVDQAMHEEDTIERLNAKANVHLIWKQTPHGHFGWMPLEFKEIEYGKEVEGKFYLYIKFHRLAIPQVLEFETEAERNDYKFKKELHASKNIVWISTTKS